MFGYEIKLFTINEASLSTQIMKLSICVYCTLNVIAKNTLSICEISEV